MSDDEDDAQNPADDSREQEDDDEFLNRNVVASTLASGGGGAFVNTVATGTDVSSPTLRPQSGNVSPLIAQLSPFVTPPTLELPPASGEQGDSVDQNSARDSDTCSPRLQNLLVEMGDLMCLLQRDQDLYILCERADNSAMLAQLDHFRNLAGRAGYGRHRRQRPI